MSTYEQGFTAGESAAFIDRKDGHPLRHQPLVLRGPWARGWWDGYTPRSAVWALKRSPVTHWQETPEAEPA